MKKTMMLLVAILFVNLTNAQDKPNVFMTASEFLQGNPSKYFDFTLKQRSLGTIFMLGGISNYVIKKIRPSSESENMSKYVWGVKVGDSIYINAYPYSKRHGYNKIIEKGYYSYFIGEPAQLKDEQLKLGMINEGDPQMWVCCRTCFVILTDGSVKFLNPELLMKLIADNSELLKQLQANKLKQENIYEMFDFLYRYNQSKK